MDIDLALFSDLKDKDFAGRGLAVLEGRIVIEKALQHGVRLEGILRSEDSGSEWLDRVEGVPIGTLPHDELCAIAGFKFHHGALGIARRPALKSLDELADLPGASLCLWNVTDPSNVGALIRSAVGLGAEALLLGEGCADPYYRKALRASMGNAFSLPIIACGTDTLAALARRGCDIVAAALSPDAVPLEEASAKRPLALVVGNEGYGLPRDVLDRCARQVYIPMRPGLDSLNVVVAGSICMYELFKRL